ncbi:MAG TPA: 5'/3'-nucleotidase SurE, partial [Clostridia bacterium]|nr:5'/3'-nucleotidase SurE [Clostridia bacterium]
MKVLLTNDDGIYAHGIYALAACFSSKHEVTIVAPEAERSASGHAITLKKIIRYEAVNLPGLACPAYKIDGTPADSVKFAVDVILREPPDIIV